MINTVTALIPGLLVAMFFLGGMLVFAADISGHKPIAANSREHDDIRGIQAKFRINDMNNRKAKIESYLSTDDEDSGKSGIEAKLVRKRRETSVVRPLFRAVVEKCGNVAGTKSVCITRGTPNKKHFDTYFPEASDVNGPEQCVSQCTCQKSSHFALAYSEQKLKCFCSKRNHGFDEIIWAGDNEPCIANEKCKVQGQQLRCGTRGSAMIYNLRDGKTLENWADVAGGSS